MEKKSALVGGGIGLAIGMAAMFGIVMGIGSCAGSQNVKKVVNTSVLVERPKMVVIPQESYPVHCWRVDSVLSNVPEGFDLTLFYGGSSSSGDITILAYQAVPYSGGSYDPVHYSFHTESVVKGSWGLSNGGSIQYSGGALTLGSKPLYIQYDLTGTLTAQDQAFLSLIDTKTPGYITGQEGSGSSVTLAFEEESTPEPAPTGGLISDIFRQVGESISNFATALGDSVGQAVGLFYDDGFTPLGILTLVSGGIALVYWTFYLVKKMLHIGVK